MTTDKDPLVIFTPSGKRGRFPAGTPVLTAARQLGVSPVTLIDKLNKYGLR